MKYRHAAQPRSHIKSRSHANRGMHLERIIDMANNKYRNTGTADIRKIPTPVKILSTKGNTVSGHLEKATWVDYSGVYDGKAIIFDAKEISSATSYPLSKIHEHQYRLLESWNENGAIAFLIVYFKAHDKYFMLPFEVLRKAWEGAKNGGRKSIAWETFENECYEVKSKDGYALHYLDVVNN